MSGSDLSLLGFALLLVTAVVFEVAGRLRRDVATAGQAAAAAMRSTAGRAVVLGTWLWLGVHFLAR